MSSLIDGLKIYIKLHIYSHALYNANYKGQDHILSLPLRPGTYILAKIRVRIIFFSISSVGYRPVTAFCYAVLKYVVHVISKLRFAK